MDDFSKTQNIYPNLDAIPLNANISNEQKFRLNKINEIKDYFLGGIGERELISKNLSKYIASLDYFDKSLIVLSVLSGSISIASFASAIGVPTGIISESFGLSFEITSGFVKKFLKRIRNKKKKYNKIVMLARSKLNSTENKISKDFEIIINEEKKYLELKESFRMWNSDRSNAEKVHFVEEGKQIGINEGIKHNEIVNYNLKYKYV